MQQVRDLTTVYVKVVQQRAKKFGDTMKHIGDNSTKGQRQANREGRRRGLALTAPALFIGSALVLSGAFPHGVAQARLNPISPSEWNCTAVGADSGTRAGLYIKGTLFYGADDDRHGTDGYCSYLTPVIAVQGSLKLVANFLIPAGNYKTGWLNAARGTAKVTMTSNARSEVEKEARWAGNLSVSKDSLGVGISHKTKKDVKIFTYKPRSTTFRLTAKVPKGQAKPCRNAGRQVIGDQEFVRVQCTWETSRTAISYTAPEQRTTGGLRTIKVTFTARLANAQHSYTLIMADDGDG